MSTNQPSSPPPPPLSDNEREIVVKLARSYFEGFYPIPRLLSGEPYEDPELDETDPAFYDHYNIYPNQGDPKLKFITALADSIRQLIDGDVLNDFGQFTEQIVAPVLYPEAVQWIRNQIAGKKLYVIMSTCEYYEHDLVVVVVGTLDEANHTFLVNCAPLPDIDDDEDEEGDKEFYRNAFLDSMKLLYPEDPNSWTEHIRLLITEPSADLFEDPSNGDIYKASEELAALAPKMIYLTCLNELLVHLEVLMMCPNRPAERESDSPYAEFNCRLMGPVQMVISTYEEHFDSFSGLAPVPDTLRSVMPWIDWLYANFDGFKKLLPNLYDSDDEGGDEEDEDREDWNSQIDLIAKSMENPQYRRMLALLKVKYASLCAARKTLQTDNIPLKDAITSVEQLREKLSKWPDAFEQAMCAKLNQMLANNSGYGELVRLINSETEPDRALFAKAPAVAYTLADCFPRFDGMLEDDSAGEFPINLFHYYAVVYCAHERAFSM